MKRPTAITPVRQNGVLPTNDFWLAMPYQLIETGTSQQSVFSAGRTYTYGQPITQTGQITIRTLDTDSIG